MAAARAVSFRRPGGGKRIGAASDYDGMSGRRQVPPVELVSGDWGASVCRSRLLTLAIRLADGMFEGAAELERHNAVEYRVDDGADVVENAGDVEEDGVEDGRLPEVGVDRQEALGVEGSPTEEEGNDHGHC